VVLAPYFGGPQKVTTGSLILDGVVAAFVAFAITWSIAFAFRFVRAASKIHSEQTIEIEALRASLVPTLELSYDRSHCRVFTAPAHGLPPDACYIRLLAKNSGANAAKECFPMLTALKGIDASGTPNEIGYVDKLPLIWSNIGPARLTITAGEERHIDVTVGKGQFLIPLVDPAGKMRIGTPGTYRFTAQLFGINAKSDPINLDVVWTGQWNTVEAST